MYCRRGSGSQTIRAQSEAARYYTARRDGRTYFSVIYGLYPSHEATTREMTRLPSTLQDIKPWIRNVGKLQAVVEE